jgi:uncharacterized FlaG/YvyC family protein
MAISPVHANPADPVVKRADAERHATNNASRKQETNQQQQVQQQRQQTADTQKLAAAKSDVKQAQDRVNIHV